MGVGDNWKGVKMHRPEQSGLEVFAALREEPAKKVNTNNGHAALTFRMVLSGNCSLQEDERTSGSKIKSRSLNR